ncbi:WcbI family polysaccharide biosynthesis putative acetyltransferase [Rhizobium puerariae]|uniref:WcbI family polysaccharide biosynthesis putative acetyltransferase n=1 Tax=Rhizobium puerariae TaxID=1585791 RepID=A0ABV6AEH7_9HYPH
MNTADLNGFLMESWLILSNCQTFGLANSLKLLNPRFRIDSMDVWGFRKNIEKYKEDLPRYFRVVVHPQFRNIDFDFTIAQNLDFIPSINFDAYHPDVCYAFSNGPIDSPMGSYHSMIVLAAYEAGLTTEATRKLFRRDVFERCDFFSRWEQERTQLLKHFSQYGLDISSSFAQWSRGDAFMYSVNHPKIRCIYDIARIFMKRLGVNTVESDLLPADNLLNGPCYPVYPEIAEVFGTRGSYLFKVPNEYRLISLEKFIERSFEVYASLPPNSIQVESAVRPRYANIKAVIAEAAR